MTRTAEHVTPEASRSVAAKCACGKSGGSCGCGDKVQAWAPTQRAAQAASPQAVRARLGDGQPLPSGVRSRMKGALGHDFGRVRVHADGAAQGAARDLGARAFTIGHDVAFGASEWRPGTLVGDAILAHELAHVAQQREGGASGGEARSEALEHDADTAAASAVGAAYGLGTASRPRLTSGLRLQRCGGGGGQRQGAQTPAPAAQASGFSCGPGAGTAEAARAAAGSPSSLDQQGQALVTLAGSAPPDQVAVGLVTRIICTYFPDRANLVSGVIYQGDIYDRLDVATEGTGPQTRARIIVGNRFVEDAKAGKLARLVLSVDHELFHIQQIRGQTPQGDLGGSDRATKDEREFLAYYRTATSQAVAGTGRYGPGERLAATRAALGYYQCLPEAKKTAYRTMQAELLRQYATLQPQTTSTEPPPEGCSRGSRPTETR
jgi:hypothetical protein